MPRPRILPFPLPSLRGAATAPGHGLRRRWRRARRSRLAWWLCAVAVGIAGAQRLSAAGAEVGRAQAAWGTTVEVAVATRDLPAGHRIRPADVRAERWPSVVVAGAAPPVDDLVGRALRTDVVAGEAVVAARLAEPGASAVAGRTPPGHRAVGIAAHPAPPLEVGDRVDVVDTSVPTVVAAAVVVVDVADDGTVTVAVPEADATEVARASALAPLALTLLGS